jgi:bla regulator protein blaR1
MRDRGCQFSNRRIRRKKRQRDEPVARVNRTASCVSIVDMLNIWISVVLTLLFSQSSSPKPAFEIVSIKPNLSGDNRVSITNQPGGRFVATGVPLRFLMTSAYRVREFQILGGPAWITSDRWDIDARPAEAVARPSVPVDPSVPDTMSLMVQSLIEDRFQLKMHRETREQPVYELVVAKGGSKMKLSDDQTPVQPPQRGGEPAARRNSIRTGRGDLEATGIQFGIFVNVLSQQLGRPVVDKTGLAGFYDFRLQWTPQLTPQPDSDSSGPTIFTALQEQLGLRLESAKGAVEVIIIDGIQKPSEN